MANWTKVKVEKKNCVLVKGNRGFPGKYKIIMPQNGKYAEYHFLHSENLCSMQPNYCAVMFSDEYIFSLIRTKREPGQRFPRPKLNAQQFKEAFAEMDKHLDRKDGEMWLAEVTDYLYSGQIEINRSKRYAVGSVEGKWLYLNADEKRRISADGLKLIRPLDKEDVEEFKAICKEHQACFARVHDINEYNRGFRQLRQDLSRDFGGIKDAEDNLFKAICNEREIAENALFEQEKRFEKFTLKNTDKENENVK